MHIRLLLLSLIALAACSTGASASSTKLITLPLHGTLFLANSHIACGSGTSHGQVFIDCGIEAKNGQPKPGSYVALMADSGKVSLINASTNKIVFNRAPAMRERRAFSGPTVHPGDVISLPTARSISCQISSVGGKTTIICYYVDKKGVVKPGSYSFGMSDVVATALGWDAARKAHLINHWVENG
jgi:hypothetical protein